MLHVAAARPEFIDIRRASSPPLDSWNPWHASSLPPFVRARSFLEYVGTLSATEWIEVLRRAANLDPHARRSAMQRTGELLTAHTRRRACDALVRVAHDAVDSARDDGRLLVTDLRRAAALACGSAFALVVRDRLLPAEFDALYAPFERTSLASRHRGDVIVPAPSSAAADPLGGSPDPAFLREVRSLRLATVHEGMDRGPGCVRTAAGKPCAPRCARHEAGECRGRM